MKNKILYFIPIVALSAYFMLCGTVAGDDDNDFFDLFIIGCGLISFPHILRIIKNLKNKIKRK